MIGHAVLGSAPHSRGLSGLGGAGRSCGGCGLARQVLRALGGVQLVVPGDPALQVLRMGMLVGLNTL